MNTETAVLEALYEKIRDLPIHSVGTDAQGNGYRAALARARVFVLDERAGVIRAPA
ncbi:MULTISPECIES: hypothetical protein [Rhodococcus]|uniref:Uncharacterized protein n=1 Tax=Rhodococcus artemisiae TaxID=714159 RepID=A0ABU7LG69_9NOCA|nr:MULTISPECIES: hypothetical protein [Rhodococcus]MEE2060544.1 hypothetical protein [Rhodococcus artemisiae]TCN52809.1 hypothetical protein EV641_107168 [Rhodococcus sp. SMB37]